jgi:hypothetical protein
MAMYAMLAGAVLLLITNVLAKKFQTAIATAATPPQWAAAMALKMWTMMAGYAAIAAGLAVVFAGVMLMSKFGQKWMGGMYIAAGLMIVWKAYEAMSGLGEGGETSAGKETWTVGDKTYVQPSAAATTTPSTPPPTSTPSSIPYDVC